MMATFVDVTVYMTCLSAKRKASGTTGFPSNNTSTNSTQVDGDYMCGFLYAVVHDVVVKFRLKFIDIIIDGLIIY